RLAAGLAQLERNTRDLQDAILAIRMLPISFVFSRLPRLTRDLADRLGKEVELEMLGEDTELDKSVIEKIADPLTHLVRNAIDHGIETPAERVANGKPATGMLTVRAAHQGGSIAITVTDDGAGLNRDKIVAKARELGLDAGESWSDEEIWQLIFTPGFSTAKAVTDVSGRGVGMDVVWQNVHMLGGKIEIDSIPGQGTSMMIRLPLTLAILDGMSVAVSGETYILPLANIAQSLQPAASDIKTVNGSEVVLVRDEYLPITSVADLFNLPAPAPQERDGILVVLEMDDKRAAVRVDDLLGQHQVVLKSLEANFRRVKGVTGATILGDGRVAFILDAGYLVSVAHSVAREKAAVAHGD
ncbi:MAG: chemotaxis protein CheA, partial [Betaproteobacteria bacterium]|nr:chemotaxis protein CheA [Betaproteobacteria bacterium]